MQNKTLITERTFCDKGTIAESNKECDRRELKQDGLQKAKISAAQKGPLVGGGMKKSGNERHVSLSLSKLRTGSF